MVAQEQLSLASPTEIGFVLSGLGSRCLSAKPSWVTLLLQSIQRSSRRSDCYGCALVTNDRMIDLRLDHGSLQAKSCQKTPRSLHRDQQRACNRGPGQRFHRPEPATTPKSRLLPLASLEVAAGLLDWPRQLDLCLKGCCVLNSSNGQLGWRSRKGLQRRVSHHGSSEAACSPAAVDKLPAAASTPRTPGRHVQHLRQAHANDSVGCEPYLKSCHLRKD